ncbi:MAG: lipoyl synthase [Candidatus Diapherotrites archaeon]
MALGERKPDWLKKRFETNEKFFELSNELEEKKLHSVCVEARCPNKSECWNKGTATFLVLGNVCTRNCGFCATKSAKKGNQVDGEEPRRLAEAVKKFGLKYAVITSVDRDDLDDFGAGHFARCIEAVKSECPDVKVEVLVPDFQGRLESIETVVNAKPDVFGHNIETVGELTGKVRDGKASYETSLNVLRTAKEIDAAIKTKSSLLLGLGETKAQLLQALDDLREAEVDFLAIGQYLQPSAKNLPVKEFVSPERFGELRKIALKKGFSAVASAPFVRSSYLAHELFVEADGKI